MADKEVKITLTIDGVAKEVKNVEDLQKEMSKLGKETKQASEEGTALGMLKERFSGLIKPIKGVIMGMKTLRGAIISTGIGALVVALGSLVAYFTSSEQGSKKLAIATEALSLLFGKLTDFAAELGEKIAWVFENPKQALLDFKDLLVNNIIERFNSLLEVVGSLASAFKNLFMGEFSAALEDVKNAGAEMVDVFTGVDGSLQKMADGAVDAFNAVKNAVEDATETAMKLVNAQIAIRDQQQKLTVENAQLNQELEAQRKIAEDTTLSYEERKAALEEVGNIQIKLAENVAAQAKAEEDLLKLKIENESNYEKREELETQLAEATAARIDAQTALNTVEQEAGKLGRELDLEELDRKKAINDMLKAMELENMEDAFARAQAELSAQEASALAELDRLRATEDEKTKLKDEFTKKRNRLTKEEADFNKAMAVAVQQANLEAYSQGLGAISRLVGENTAFGKAAAIAATTIDTYIGAQKAYTSQLIPGDPTSPVRAAIAAGVAVANGLANVKAILSTKTPGGETGGGAAPTRPNIRTFDPSSALGAQEAGGVEGINTTAGIGRSNGPVIKAYVVAEEMTSSQEANKKIDDLARL